MIFDKLYTMCTNAQLFQLHNKIYNILENDRIKIIQEFLNSNLFIEFFTDLNMSI